MNHASHQNTPSTQESKHLSIDRQPLLHAARGYVDQGWSVIPLHGKRPALSTWREFQSSKPSLAQLTRWFGDASHNIGIVTGRISNLVVVDCDTVEDADFWRDAYSQTPLSARSGRGGSHFYYRFPISHDVTNRAGLLGRRIDLRAEGGYIVAPPSRHPLGEYYKWEEGAVLSAGLPDFVPDWIADAQPTLATCLGISEVQNPRSYIRAIRAISGQYGHNQTFRAACILRDSGLTPEEALCELVAWNETNADPPWTVRELLHKVQSAFRSHRVD